VTGFGGLFRDGRASLAQRSELPRAIRPAVEIIARISAERNKLRVEVARLRERLRKAPRPEDLAQLRAERDALGRELTILKTRNAKRTDASGASRRSSALSRPLASLVERLERAVVRMEAPRPIAVAPRPAPAPAPAAPKASRSRPIRRPKLGGGMLAGLVTENISLRSDALPRPEPQPASPKPEPINTRGGGLLSGLFTQNLSLRGVGEKHK